jgi:hypothetical protein
MVMHSKKMPNVGNKMKGSLKSKGMENFNYRSKLQENIELRAEQRN